jgi:hypothetical protein
MGENLMAAEDIKVELTDKLHIWGRTPNQGALEDVVSEIERLIDKKVGEAIAKHVYNTDHGSTTW